MAQIRWGRRTKAASRGAIRHRLIPILVDDEGVVFNINPGLATPTSPCPRGWWARYSQTLAAMNVNTVNLFSGTPATGRDGPSSRGRFPAGVTL